MPDSATILLTGATGFLGRRLAYRLAGSGLSVACLVRASGPDEARERMASTFHQLQGVMPDFDVSLETRLIPIPGDIRRPAPELIKSLSGIRPSVIWHLAALNDWSGMNDQEVYDTNYKGTLNILDLARELGVRELHALSAWTACGHPGRGVVREIPGIRPAEFRSLFERTKWEMERCLWQAQVRGELSVTLYRPGLLAAETAAGKAGALQQFLGSLGRLRARLCRDQGVDPQHGMLRHELDVPVPSNAALQIVPVDHVLDLIFRLLAIPDSRGRIYHLINPSPPTAGAVLELFGRHARWEGLRCDGREQKPPSPVSEEQARVIARLKTLCPDIGQDLLYDQSNLLSMLAFHGGLPPIDTAGFLEAAVRGGVQSPAPSAALEVVSRIVEPAARLEWPDQQEMTVDYSAAHPLGDPPESDRRYSLTEKVLGRAYRVREQVLGLVRKRRRTAAPEGGRDIVLVPFGMGVTRRGEAEQHCYRHNEVLARQVFGLINQIAGFDVRAFANQEIPGHASFADIDDHCAWAVTDDLVNAIRLFRDIQRTGGSGLLPRLQVLPHSAGVHISGWLSGVMSLQDALLMTLQTTFFMAEGDRLLALKEVDRWFYREAAGLADEERAILQEVRARHEPELEREALAERLHGKLELVYSLNSEIFDRFLKDLYASNIGVAHAITMSPNAGVFAGDELQMAKFRKMFAAKGYIGLRRMPLDVRGTPHNIRFDEAARHTVELLEEYDRQGRLRDPVVPLTSCDGAWVRTRQEYIHAVAGNAGRAYHFDRMIQLALEAGGRRFLLLQSGLVTLTGDLFEGVIHNKANDMGISPVEVHRPAGRSPDPHPVCKTLSRNPGDEVPDALTQPLADTVAWYESQLAEAVGPQSAFRLA